MYTQLAEIPVPTGAQFITRHDSQGPTVVQVSYSVRDHVRNSKRTMSKSIVINEANGSSPFSATGTPLEDTSDAVAQVVSASGKRRAVLRNVKAGEASANRYVEVWYNGLLETSLNVTDHHGDFYTDEFLGSLAFAPSESAIVYIAEGKAPDAESKDPFQKFRYNPDFGEGLVGKRRPTIFVLRWSDMKPTLFQLNTTECTGVRFGQPIFSPNSSEIIYATGYEFTKDGRILGIKGCFNRPSGIWQLCLPSELPKTDNNGNSPVRIDIDSFHKLTPPHLSCRSPRTFTCYGRSMLAWLACATGGAHLATSSLYSLDISSDSSGAAALDTLSSDAPLVGIVEAPLPDISIFPGLYPAYNLPFSPIVDSLARPSILLQSQWGSRTTVLQLSAKDGAVKELTPDADNLAFSWSVLTTDGRSSVVCSRSSPSVPYEILLGRFESEGKVSWHSIDKPELPKSIAAALSNIQTSIVPIPGHHLVETIVIQSENIEGKTEGSLPPCITLPHGGPHAATSTAFSATTSALALEGYTISLPNYTGSPGYGEAFLQGLIGRCGELDVKECITSAQHLIKIGISEEGPGKQFITGGSHGGFLTAHLIGQFPNFFSAAVLRNPVISVGEISSTDIPDWYFSEFGLSFPMSSASPAPSVSQPSEIPLPPPLVTVDTFKKLHAASPIAYIDSIRVPVLLQIGKADRRVAPSHGTEFYHALKARYADGQGKGRRVEMLVFEGESHPLDGVEAAKVNFEVTRDWFEDAKKFV